MAGRKDKVTLQNLGGAESKKIKDFFRGGPPLSAARTAVVQVERVLLAILRSEVERIAADESEIRRFLGHLFAPIAGEDAVDEYVARFKSRPPETILNYPRSTTSFPCYAIVLEQEDEAQGVLADYLGESLEGEEGIAAEYEGSVWQQTHSIYVYAEHPDECVYLYHFAKMILVGSGDFLTQAGLIDVGLSGGELSPEEVYLPENLFCRVVKVSSKSVLSVPAIVHPDPARARVGGIFRDDVVVDGLPGAVGTYEPSSEEE